MSMEIIPFYEEQSCTWTYLLADTGSGAAAVIDPVWVYDMVSGLADRGFVDRVLGKADERGWNIEWVLETHAHADHLSAGALIRDETGAKLAAGSRIVTVQQTFKKIYNLHGLDTNGAQFDRLMSEGDEIHLGDLTLWVMETPGHTSDSITWVVRDAAFIGDTLFAPGYGSARCDFPGGNAGQLFDSIQRIYGLPGDTRLFLCHDYPHEGAAPRSEVSVSECRQSNVHIREDTTRKDFIELRETRDAGLSLPKLIFPAIQVNIIGGSAPPAESNGASYLKIPFNTSIDALLKRK